jgi:selenide,water dikinase
LILTKPLGTGVVASAIKNGRPDPAVVQAAVASMRTLNDLGSRTAMAHGATGGTDVTGFGMLGHLAKMTKASGVDAEVSAGSVPLLEGVMDLARGGFVPGGSKRNLAWVRDRLRIGESVDDLAVQLLADAQTSGGLLFGVDESQRDEVLDELAAAGLTAAEVGRVAASTGSGLITIRQ